MADDEVTRLLQELRLGLFELRKITEGPVEVAPAPGPGNAWLARALDGSREAGLFQMMRVLRNEPTTRALMTGHDPGDEDDAASLLGLFPPESIILHEDFDEPLFIGGPEDFRGSDEGSQYDVPVRR